jgi:hypothetical protein
MIILLGMVRETGKPRSAKSVMQKEIVNIGRAIPKPTILAGRNGVISAGKGCLPKKGRLKYLLRKYAQNAV